MNSDEKKIVEDLVKNNAQRAVARDDMDIQFLKAESTMSEMFYNYLRGTDKKGPSFDMIDKWSEGKSDIEPVSVFAGLIIYNDNGDLKITYEEPINDSKSRIDEITADSYTAQIHGDGLVDINVEEDPAFDLQRIQAVQNYMEQYKEHVKEIKKSI